MVCSWPWILFMISCTSSSMSDLLGCTSAGLGLKSISRLDQAELSDLHKWAKYQWESPLPGPVWTAWEHKNKSRCSMWDRKDSSKGEACFAFT